MLTAVVSFKFMIDTDETGQKKLDELIQAHDSFGWTQWEWNFIDSVNLRIYRQLSSKQKDIVGRLHDKLKGK